MEESAQTEQRITALREAYAIQPSAEWKSGLRLGSGAGKRGTQRKHQRRRVSAISTKARSPAEARFCGCQSGPNVYSEM